VLQMWEEVVISRLEKKVAGARELAEADESPQARAALDAARNERDRLETEILVGRCLREPENAEFRYQLGLRLKRAGKLREACVALQAALAGSSQKALAALAIGECHEELDEVPEALKHFRLAADSAFIPDQVECKQRALYEASRLVVGLNLPRLAQRYLGELLRLAPEHAEGAQLLAQVAAGESSSPPSPPHTIG
jgi:tetratricopeptide (TPR) repeat protein